MPREMSQDMMDELQSTLVYPCLIVSIAFPSETVRCWTGLGLLSWNGQDYQGIGALGGMSTITEGLDVNAEGITLTMSGIKKVLDEDPDLLADALDTTSQIGRAEVYLGLLRENMRELIADPIPAFIGRADQPHISLDSDDTVITISVENRLADLNRSRGGRYTDQDQRSRYPNDGGLKYVHFLQDTRINWQ